MFHSTSERRVHSYGPRAKLSNIQFARYANGKKDNCVIKIPLSIAGVAGLINGDKIDILVDSINNKAAIVRCNKGGWKLGMHKDSGYLKTAFSEFSGGICVSLEKKTSIIPRYEITEIGIVFDMPPSLIIKA